jgi:hypothetical protein
LRRLISVVPANAPDDYDVNIGRMRHQTAKPAASPDGG